MPEIYQGHVLNILKTFPDESVNCVITSPPYWGLRDYGLEPIIWDADPNCEHEWGDSKYFKADHHWDSFDNRNSGTKRIKTRGENKLNYGFCLKCSAWRGSLGLEPTFELYLKHLLEIFDEIKRVLKKDGTCWVNLGDSYSGSWGNRSHKPETKHLNKFNVMPADIAPLTANVDNIPPKSLCLIPYRFAIGMVERGWICRNIIIRKKPNCMPSSANDRFTVDFEPVFFFSKSRKYWFEQQFEEHLCNEKYQHGTFGNKSLATSKNIKIELNPQGRNKRCVWTIPTQPFAEAHFAVFPEALVEPMIKAGCPEFVCKKCGKAREKILERQRPPEECYTKSNLPDDGLIHSGQRRNGVFRGSGQKVQNWLNEHPPKEIGYTDCNCNAGFEGGIVLDPFCGSGTTLRVAEKLNRRWIGIDLKPEYKEMSEKRLKGIQKVLI